MAGGVLLHPPAHVINDLGGELDHVKGVQHRSGVLQLVIDGVLVPVERVQGGDLDAGPEQWLGQYLDARADWALVKLSHRGKLVKTHPRQPPGGRCTEAGDLPAERAGYAMRDLTKLIAVAGNHGENVGIYAERLLDDPLPWTRMRSVYRLLGLVRRYGPGPVETAAPPPWTWTSCRVSKIAAMPERACENQQTRPTRRGRYTDRAVRPRPRRVHHGRRRHPAQPHPRRPDRPPRNGDHPMSISVTATRISTSTSTLASSTGPGPVDPIGTDLAAVLRALKLSGLRDTLPERLVLARTRKMGHAAFLELLLSDEVARRDSRSAGLRAKAAGLDPSMRLDT